MPNGEAVDFCSGYAFIGQLTTNSIEAFSETRCTTGNFIFTNTETRIKPAPDSLEVLSSNGATAADPPDNDFVTAATSIPGGAPGTQYCVLGFGAASDGLNEVSGGGTVCITTR